MSEAERKRRQHYKKNRKRWIIAQALILALVSVISIFSFIAYNRMNQTYYIEYTEESKSDYIVQYKDNTFFGEEWIPSGKSYVSALVKAIKADFAYKMNMDTSNVGFDYTYKITAQTVVADKQSGTPIYSPVDVLLQETTKHAENTNSFTVAESVTVDFVKYNTLANQFVSVYGLSNTDCYLTVTLSIDVVSSCEDFESNGANNHSVSINLPLREENFSIDAMASVPNGESKVLACKDTSGQRLFATVGSAGLGLAVLLAVVLIIYIYATRNEDINYSNKVRKLLSAYRSFIQQIDGEFDTAGYQLVPIKTFTELLNIRDTIQSPILMSENEDETKSQFLIPTNTKLLYLFEIKVDNYDEIYSKPVEPDAKPEANREDTEEPEKAEVSAVYTEETAQDNNSDESDTPDTDVSDDSEVEDDGEIAVFDENNNKILIKCTRSCLANIIQSDNAEAKAYYSKLKNHILSYKGVKARMSWKHESFNKGRDQLFKLKIRGKTICLYCALNPDEFEVTKYFHKAVTSKAYEKVPMLIKIRSDRALARALRLVDLVMSNLSIKKDSAYAEVDYVRALPYERTQALIDRSLIKILVPDGYVAIDPYHIVKAEENAELDTEGSDELDSIDTEGEIEVLDENNNKILIKCTRSCLANIIQSDKKEAKAYYSKLKNHILSYKGVKARMSWKHESFNKGRDQLFKLKIRGKTICLYCALNPDEFEVTKYFHKAVVSKAYEKVPMLIKIRSDRALARALRLVDLVMSNFSIKKNPAYTEVDYVRALPYERTKALINRSLIKILTPKD